MFSKILIANRGEIAVRIAVACREMGITSVAVYSDADVDSLHSSSADEALCIGPAAAARSYLDIDRVVQAALASESDAVHPGYGFLAENASFARAVIEAGLTWIGPPPAAMELMGDKIAAKSLATQAGVPVLQGYTGDDQSPGNLRIEAESVGYPLMVKAAAGGGGRGMRVVSTPDALDEMIEAARREAISAFGDGRLFLEPLLLFPRHIEIQIFADTFGNIVYLGERDCSAQRRHQKILEESPSPVLTRDLRQSMGSAAVRLARMVDYVGAGTVEFLFANDSFYFLEMNTRIQVEHPVTEEVTGLDLVQWQIKAAALEPLPLSQQDITMRGHAIEARVYAEDPESQFLPSTGTITTFHAPGGPGVRNDAGVQAGSQVSHFYDALLGKLVVHAATRELAIHRLARALKQYEVLGVTTNLAFLQWLVATEEFRSGRLDVGFIDRSWTTSVPSVLPLDVLWLAAVFSISETPGDDSPTREKIRDPWLRLPSWRHTGQGTTLRFRFVSEVRSVRVAKLDGNLVRLQFEDDVAEGEPVLGRDGRIGLRLTDRVISGRCAERDRELVVSWEGNRYSLLRDEPGQRPAGSEAQRSRQAGLAAPMPATVVKLAVTDGDRVQEDQPLVVLEAMKTEHVVRAPNSGVVRLLYGVGDLVPAGAAIAIVNSE